MSGVNYMSSEELYEFGSWLYYILEGWNDPDWWSKHDAERYGHVLNVIFTSP